MKRKLWAILSELLVASMLVVNMPTLAISEQCFEVEAGTDAEKMTGEETDIEEDIDIEAETSIDEDTDIGEETGIDEDTGDNEKPDGYVETNIDEESDIDNDNSDGEADIDEEIGEEAETEAETEEETDESEEVEDLATSEETKIEDLKAGSAPFTFTLNGVLNEEYNNIIEAVAAIGAEDEATIKLLNNIVLPDKEPIVLSAGKLTLDLNGYKLSGEGYSNTTYDSDDSDSEKTSSIIYIDGSNVTLIISGNGKIEGRNITHRYFMSYAVCTYLYAVNVSIIHENGTISGNGGIKLYDGSLESHGSYEVDMEAINVSNGDVQIDGVNITVKPRNSICPDIFCVLTGINLGVKCGGKQSNIKNTDIKIENKISEAFGDFDFGSCGIFVTGGVYYSPEGTVAYASPNFENDTVSIISYDSGNSQTGIDCYVAESSFMKNIDISIVNKKANDEYSTMDGVLITAYPGAVFESDDVDVSIDGSSSHSIGYSVNYEPNRNEAKVNEGCSLDIHDSDIDITCSHYYCTCCGISGFGDFSDCNINVRGNAYWLEGMGIRAEDSEIGVLHTSLKNVKITAENTSSSVWREDYGVYGIGIYGRKNQSGMRPPMEVTLCEGTEIAVKSKSGKTALLMSRDNEPELEVNLDEGCTWIDKDGNEISDLTGKTYAKVIDRSNTPYDIMYVLDGGENNSDNPSTYSLKHPVTFAPPVKAGYEFGGWYTDSEFAEDSKITTTEGKSGKLTVYAKWIPHSYTISFDANYPESALPEECSGSMVPENMTVGVEKTLTQNTFSCIGYDFMGWNTSSDGKGTAYSDIAKVKDLALEEGAEVVLYATWVPTKYKVSSVAGNYTIGLNEKPSGTKLNSTTGYNDEFIFWVKAKTGYILDEVSCKIGTGDSTPLNPETVDAVKGNKYIIPTKTIDDAVVISISALKVQDYSSATIKPVFGDLTYTGEPIVADSIEVLFGKQPVSSSDYDVEYINNTDAGTAILRISAKEGSKVYSGHKDYAFKISGAMITDTKAVSISNPKSVKWNGAGLETKANIELKSVATGSTLEEGVDYKLVYSNNVKPGTAKVTIIGIGGYDGSKDISFTIEKPSFATATDSITNGSIYVSKITDTYVFDNKAKVPAPTVMYVTPEGDEITLTDSSDYKVKLSSNIKAGTAKMVISGTGNYTGSLTRTFDIEKMNLESLPAGYNIKVTAPSVKVGKNDAPVTTKPVVELICPDKSVMTLKAGTDYEKLTNDYFSDNEGKTNEAKVKIVGKGNFCGEVFGTYTIADKSITDKSVVISIPTASSKSVFTGEKIEPEVSVNLKDSSGNLTPLSEENYVVEYSNNVNVGKAKITVFGINEYYGSKTLSFNIVQRKISEKTGETGVLDNLSISMDGQIITKDMATGMEYLYTGYAIKPVVTIKDTGILQTGEGYDLVEGKDYSVSVSANTNAGTAKATISFKGSYSGKLVKTFKIVPWSLVDATVTVDDVQYNNGKAANPVVTVTIDGDAVNPKSVKCTYFNNKNVTKPGEPEPYVVIKGASTKNIAGEVQKTFNVIEGDLSNAVISNISPQKFAGLAVTPKFTVSYNKTKLVEGRDYTVSYEKDSVPTNNKKGVAHITVTAVDGGNFVGQASTTFVIK